MTPADLELVRRIAGSIARRLPSHVDRDELIALGNLGLVEARSRWDERRGVPFATFAAARIRGAILDGLRGIDPLSREERARVRKELDAQPSVTLVQMEAAQNAVSDTQDASEIVEDKQDAAELYRALGELPDRERQILVGHYFQDRRLRTIGEEIGVTESRVCQVVRRTVEGLRQHMQRRHHRHRFVSLVLMEHGDETFVGISHDISRGGLRVDTSTPPPVGARVLVRLALPGARSPHAGYATVRWQNETGCGLAWEEELDEALTTSLQAWHAGSPSAAGQ